MHNSSALTGTLPVCRLLDSLLRFATSSSSDRTYPNQRTPPEHQPCRSSSPRPRSPSTRTTRPCTSLSTTASTILPVCVFLLLFFSFLKNVLLLSFHLSRGLYITHADIPRLPRRAPRRRKDPQAHGRQGRHQAVLEVPQQERAREVWAQAQGRHPQGGGQAVKRGGGDWLVWLVGWCCWHVHSRQKHGVDTTVARQRWFISFTFFLSFFLACLLSEFDILGKHSLATYLPPHDLPC